jgi:hypothetical protein
MIAERRGVLMKRFLNTKGMALAVVMLVITIVMVLAMSIAYVGAENLRVAKKNNDNMAAYYAATAGLEQAYCKLLHDEAWEGKNPDGTWAYLRSPMPNDPNSTYSVRVYHNLYNNTPIPASSTEEGVTVPPRCIWVVSEGQVGLNPHLASRKKVGAMFRRASVFDFGLFAKDKLTFVGNASVDAYNSLTGAAAPGEADVGTNGYLTGAFTLNGNSNYIDGDVVAGPGSTTATFIVKPASWTPTGYFDTLIVPNDIPSISLPATINGVPLGSPQAIPKTAGFLEGEPVLLAMEDTYRYHFSFTSRGTDGSKVKPAGSIDLAPGYYDGITRPNTNVYILTGNGSTTNPAVYVFDRIDLTAGGALMLDNSNGPVVVYVNGPANFTGHSSVQGNLAHLPDGTTPPSPTDFRIYGTTNCTTFEFAGNPDLYAGIYAPNAAVQMNGNVDINGAVVAQSIKINGTPNVHYDIALRNAQEIPVLTVASFQRF